MITKFKLMHRIELLDYDLMELEKRVKTLEKGLKVKEPVKAKAKVSKVTKAKD